MVVLHTRPAPSGSCGPLQPRHAPGLSLWPLLDCWQKLKSASFKQAVMERLYELLSSIHALNFSFTNNYLNCVFAPALNLTLCPPPRCCPCPGCWPWLAVAGRPPSSGAPSAPSTASMASPSPPTRAPPPPPHSLTSSRQPQVHGWQ